MTRKVKVTVTDMDGIILDQSTIEIPDGHTLISLVPIRKDADDPLASVAVLHLGRTTASDVLAAKLARAKFAVSKLNEQNDAKKTNRKTTAVQPRAR